MEISPWTVIVGVFVLLASAGFYLMTSTGMLGSIGGAVEGTVNCTSGLIVLNLAVPDEYGNYGECAPDCNALPKGAGYRYQSLGKAGCASGQCCIRMGSGEAAEPPKMCSDASSDPCKNKEADKIYPTSRANVCILCQAVPNTNPLRCIVKPTDATNC